MGPTGVDVTGAAAEEQANAKDAMTSHEPSSRCHVKGATWLRSLRLFLGMVLEYPFSTDGAPAGARQSKEGCHGVWPRACSPSPLGTGFDIVSDDSTQVPLRALETAGPIDQSPSTKRDTHKRGLTPTQHPVGPSYLRESHLGVGLACSSYWTVGRGHTLRDPGRPIHPLR